MSLIKHCGGSRKTTRHQLFSLHEQFKFVWLFILKECPKCHQTAMEWQGVQHNNDYTPRFRIKNKNHDDWLIRKIQFEMALTGKPYGQHTREIHYDAEHCFQYLMEKRKKAEKLRAIPVGKTAKELYV